MQTIGHNPTLFHRVRQAAGALRWCLEGWAFAAFLLWALLFWNGAMLLFLLIPESAGALGSFAQDFRQRCLEYSTERGFDWFLAIPFLTAPLVIGVATVMVYGRQLARVWRQPRPMAATALAAMVVVVAAAAGLYIARGGAAAAPAIPPFPASALRTELPAPVFTLTNQEGAAVSPQDFRGKVVLITAIYSTCPDVCPMILAQARRVVDGLDPALRADVRVLGVTLDPENDDVPRLAGVARGHGISAPLWNLLTGDGKAITRVLADIGVKRVWNAELRRIDHNNVFLLIDRTGRVAYRFSLGEIQEQWLGQALELLCTEPEPAS